MHRLFLLFTIFTVSLLPFDQAFSARKKSIRKGIRKSHGKTRMRLTNKKAKKNKAEGDIDEQKCQRLRNNIIYGAQACVRIKDGMNEEKKQRLCAKCTRGKAAIAMAQGKCNLRMQQGPIQDIESNVDKCTGSSGAGSINQTLSE